MNSQEFRSKLREFYNLCRDPDFKNTKLTNIELGNFSIENATFDHSVFDNVRFNTSNYWNCAFSDVNFKNGHLYTVQFTKCSFRGAVFSDTVIEHTMFNSCVFDDATLIIFNGPELRFMDVNAILAYERLKKSKELEFKGDSQIILLPERIRLGINMMPPYTFESDYGE